MDNEKPLKEQLDELEYLNKAGVEELFNELFDNRIRAISIKLNEISDRLRPSTRQRLEQAQSAIKLLTAYLNEINELEKENIVKLNKLKEEEIRYRNLHGY